MNAKPPTSQPAKPMGEVFADYLREQGLRMTPQRRTILEVFLEAGDHLASEDLYARVKQVDPAIGQATVYRTLRLLSQAGLAHELRLGDGLTRYEPADGHSHHDHLVCETCGRTIEIVDERIEQLQAEQAVRHGFLLTGHRMVLFGLCPDCRGQHRGA